MKKTQLVLLFVLTTATLFCYRGYLRYCTKEKNISVDFGKFLRAHRASVDKIILCYHHIKKRKKEKQITIYA